MHVDFLRQSMARLNHTHIEKLLPDPWRWAFSISVAIFASPVILDFRLRSWPGRGGPVSI
jgi:hypothetical protein